MKPVHSFVVSAHLPEKLEALKELAYNYWWCWNTGAKELFLRIDRDIWEEVDHNPALLLNKTPQARFQELAEQADFVSYLEFIYQKFYNYINNETWFDKKLCETDSCIAYFSTEYGINESFPNYSGGLGVLSGDHMKSASDLGLPIVGIGLLYQQGYFRQHLTQHGWQNELYKYNDFYSMPITLMKDENGEPITVSVDLPFGEAFINIWKLQIGRAPLYLLDTNIDKNGIEEYRDITNQLYGGTRETRIQQEIVLGIGGMRALAALGINPEALHINEGHAAFALIERTKMYMDKYEMDFEAAKQITRATSLFTTHTPVPAGNEVFRLDRIENYFLKYADTLGLNIKKFMSYGLEKPNNGEEGYSMTVLGFKLTSYHNAVSKLHGVVARDMWQQIWKSFPAEEVPIQGITNGIHTMTWVAREFGELFDRYLSPSWQTETDNEELWDKVHLIPDEELWREKQRRRVRLVLFARQYLQKRQKGFIPPEQVSKINEYLNPDALTIGFARRFATYKRGLLLFNDMDRLAKLLTDPERPVQVVIAGKAHPHDNAGKEVIQTIIQRVRKYGLERHVVFLEDYDMIISRFMVKGCDVWLNTPIRPMEASGTSGMKAAINGALNFSILDGWWDESYDGSNGFPIGQGEEYTSNQDRNIIETGAMYNALEQIIVPMFYTRQRNNIPTEWVRYMKNSIRTIAPSFSTMRMVKEYAKEYYIPSLENFKLLSKNNGQKAALLKEWKNKIRSEWENIEILGTEIIETGRPIVGQPIVVKAEVSLGALSPEDVKVEVYYGSVDNFGELKNTQTEELQLEKSKGGSHYYKGSYNCPDNGKQGYTIRILPTHPLLVNPAELYVSAWAE